MKALSCGLGKNSTAVILGLHDRMQMPDLILFADTGGEKPHTYALLETLNTWLISRNYRGIEIVKAPNTTLEANLLKLKTLPSKTFGFGTCSQRFKIEPQHKYLNHHPMALETWAKGEKVTMIVGFDADEPHRAKDYNDDKYQNWYPLIEWDWGRDECTARIEQEGWNVGKSACFFCPSSRKSEILQLQEMYPELAERAIQMERNFTEGEKGTKVVGLGRHWKWEELLRQGDLFPEETIMDFDCNCYDGE